MIPGKDFQQDQETSTVTSPADEKRFHSGWQAWVVTNVLAGAQAQDIVAAMSRSGFSESFAEAKVREYEEHPIVDAARRATAVHRKATDILDALRKLERQSTSKQIEVASDLPAGRFYEDYFFKNRPVLLQGMTCQWKALHLWTPSYFKERFGEAEVEIIQGRNSDAYREYNFEQHKSRLPMKDYVRMVEEGGETNDYYLVAQNYLLARPEFQELYTHITGLDGYFDTASPRGHVRLWFGPRGTVTRLHHDAAPVMIAQIYGRKLVKLISPYNLSCIYSEGAWISPVDPENPDFSQYPLMRDVDVMEVTLNPGDLLFIPLGWWHWVKSLEVSISLSLDHFVVPRSQIEMVWDR